MNKPKKGTTSASDMDHARGFQFNGGTNVPAHVTQKSINPRRIQIYGHTGSKYNSSKMLSCSVAQLITVPIKVTLHSQPLIDLRMTNNHDKIVYSGVIPLGMRDHSLVYLVRKAQRIGRQVAKTSKSSR